MWTFGLSSKSRFLLTVLVLGFTPMTLIVLGPKFVSYIGGMVGYYLRRKTAGRRAQILDLVEQEEKEFQAENRERDDSDDWENIDGHTTATANNGEKADKEFDGLVGFFHPFWYAA
jgi:alpha-1,2-mannosyltransferase